MADILLTPEWWNTPSSVESPAPAQALQPAGSTQNLGSIQRPIESNAIRTVTKDPTGKVFIKNTPEEQARLDAERERQRKIDALRKPLDPVYSYFDEEGQDTTGMIDVPLAEQKKQFLDALHWRKGGRGLGYRQLVDFIESLPYAQNLQGFKREVGRTLLSQSAKREAQLAKERYKARLNAVEDIELRQQLAEAYGPQALSDVERRSVEKKKEREIESAQKKKDQEAKAVRSKAERQVPKLTDEVEQLEGALRLLINGKPVYTTDIAGRIKPNKYTEYSDKGVRKIGIDEMQRLFQAKTDELRALEKQAQGGLTGDTPAGGGLIRVRHKASGKVQEFTKSQFDALDMQTGITEGELELVQ